MKINYAQLIRVKDIDMDKLGELNKNDRYKGSEKNKHKSEWIDVCDTRFQALKRYKSL